MKLNLLGNHQTGIRDHDTIADTEKYFLKPLRSTLEKWLVDSDDPQGM